MKPAVPARRSSDLGTNENLYSEVVVLEQCEVLGLYILIVDQDVVGLHEGGLLQSALFVQKPLRIQRRHAAEAGRGDRLPVVLVGDITGGEHALDRSLRGAAAEPGADLQVTDRKSTRLTPVTNAHI